MSWSIQNLVGLVGTRYSSFAKGLVKGEDCGAGHGGLGGVTFLAQTGKLAFQMQPIKGVQMMESNLGGRWRV